MLLDVRERILLLMALPKESDIFTLRIIRDAETSIGFSEAEINQYELGSDGQVTTWNLEKGKEQKDIEIGPVLIGIIQKTLKQKSDAQALTRDHLSLCDKFGI